MAVFGEAVGELGGDGVGWVEGGGWGEMEEGTAEGGLLDEPVRVELERSGYFVEGE